MGVAVVVAVGVGVVIVVMVVICDVTVMLDSIHVASIVVLLC